MKTLAPYFVCLLLFLLLSFILAYTRYRIIKIKSKLVETTKELSECKKQYSSNLRECNKQVDYLSRENRKLKSSVDSIKTTISIAAMKSGTRRIKIKF